MWAATEDLPRTAAHPFFTGLNHTLEQHDFHEYVELCDRFYAEDELRTLAPRRQIVSCRVS